MSFKTVENRKEGTLQIEAIRPCTLVVYIDTNKIHNGVVREVKTRVNEDYLGKLVSECEYRIEPNMGDPEYIWVPSERVARTKEELLATL